MMMMTMMTMTLKIKIKTNLFAAKEILEASCVVWLGK